MVWLYVNIYIYIYIYMCVLMVQIKNDGVDSVKEMIRKGFDGTIVPIKNTRGAMHTGVTSCDMVTCVCEHVRVHVLLV